MFLRVLTLVLSTGLFDVISGTRNNIALHRHAQQSSTLNYNNYQWEARLAVDGNHGFSETCRCCSATSGHISQSWWELDLGREFNMGKIDVYGRNDNVHVQLQGFRLYIFNISLSESNLIFHDNETTESEYQSRNGHYTIKLGYVRGRYVRVTLESTVLVLCELQAFTACADGQFEPDCEPCNCGGGPCNKTDGSCLECPEGSYGVSCSPCGHCLHGNLTCDNITGQCPDGCAAGYSGSTCHQECTSPYFGLNCLNTCHCINGSHCDHVIGTCDLGLCDPGWQGPSCDKVCLPIPNCRKQLCMNNTACTECEEGYALTDNGAKCFDMFSPYGFTCSHLDPIKCYIIFKVKATWEEARDICQARRGHLFFPDNDEEEIFLETYMSSMKVNYPETRFWIGGRLSPNHKAMVKWDSNADTTVDRWFIFHPTKPDSNLCVTLDGGIGYHWRTEPCETSLLFICEETSPLARWMIG